MLSNNQINSLSEINENVIFKIIRIALAVDERDAFATQKAVIFCWSEERKNCFEIIREIILTHPKDNDHEYLFETAKKLIIVNNYEILNEYIEIFFGKLYENELMEIFSIRLKEFITQYKRNQIINQPEYNYCSSVFFKKNTKSICPSSEQLISVDKRAFLSNALPMINKLAIETNDECMAKLCEIYMNQLSREPSLAEPVFNRPQIA